MRAGESCPARVGEWLPAGAADFPCSWHHASEDGVIVVWPPEYRQWAGTQGFLTERDARIRSAGLGRQDPPDTLVGRVWHSQTRRTQNVAHLSIQNPPEGATYLIDPTLRSSYQTLAFRVSADRAAGRIEWTVNGRTVGTSDSDTPLLWPLSPGTHRIVAADDRGRRAEATILVK